MRSAVPTLLVSCTLLLGASCDGGSDEVGHGDGEGDAGPADIQVTTEQEQSMCAILASDPGTGPVPVNASAEMASSPELDVETGKMPVHLTEFEGAYGGYVAVSIDASEDMPVILLIDAPMPVAALAADGSAIEFFDAAGDSALCDTAKGRYTWYAPPTGSFLAFGPTEDAVNFDLVIETVE